MDQNQQTARRVPNGFFQEGNIIRLGRPPETRKLDRLPPGFYHFKIMGTMMGDIPYLECVDLPSLPPKIYGEALNQAQRILHTYRERGKNTGVLLHGMKGSGKSLLTKILMNMSVESGLPVIMIDEPHHDNLFKQFLQDLNAPFMLVCDEFEKIYAEREHQERILSLLDGMYELNSLVLFTVNELGLVNTGLLDRPGRIFYSLQYEGLSGAGIQEYVADNLKYKEHEESAHVVASLYSPMSFDSLKGLIEEMNRYNEPADKAIKWLNIAEPSSSYGARTFNIEVILDKEFEGDTGLELERAQFHFNPRSQFPNFEFWFDKRPDIWEWLKSQGAKCELQKEELEDGDEPDPYWQEKIVSFFGSPDELIYYNLVKGEAHYQMPGYKVIFREAKAKNRTLSAEEMIGLSGPAVAYYD